MYFFRWNREQLTRLFTLVFCSLYLSLTQPVMTIKKLRLKVRDQFQLELNFDLAARNYRIRPHTTIKICIQ